MRIFPENIHLKTAMNQCFVKIYNQTFFMHISMANLWQQVPVTPPETTDAWGLNNIL